MREIKLGEIAAETIQQEFGLPAFVYDEAVMTRQYKRLSQAYSSVDVELNYACKALSNINVLNHFRQLGAGLDCVSIQEVELGLKAGFKPSKIHFTPSGVTLGEITEAVKHGVHITLDSCSILEKFGAQYGNSHPICIRFNPNIMGGGNLKISTGHQNSKFGINVKQLDSVLQRVKEHNLSVEGVHMHTGSDILDIETFIESAEVLLNLAHHFSELKYVDFGSGFKVAYKPGERATDIEELGKRVTGLFKDFCDHYGQDLKLILEPGKFLVSEAGVLLAEVNVIKKAPTRVFAGVNTGLNHLIRPMFYDAYHHITNLSNPDGELQTYTVVGYICETDTFGTDREINAIREGDILCFHNAGAYSYQMSSNYNSRFRPAEILIRKGKYHLIRKRETMEDVLRNQIEI